MLKAADREQQRWLRATDIIDFPNTDLCTIDYLWVKYSNGRFGFTVQKRIWWDVGEDKKKFGNRIGWYIESNWKSYSNICFTLNAPMGHLPVWQWYWSGGVNGSLAFGGKGLFGYEKSEV
jgi:hypothetical protein